MASEQKALKPIDVVRAELMSAPIQQQLAMALPTHVSKEKFSRVALTTIAQNPDLLKCTRPSLFRSIMACAQLGLLPDAVLGESYIVPYKPKGAEQPIAQFQLGYKGMLKLARQSGQISTVETGVIAEKDTFEWEMGLEPKFRIVPAMGDRGDPIAVYAILRYKDGGFEYEVMTVDQVEAVREGSPSRNSPAWQNNWGEMARKTVLRRLLKKAPLSTEAAAAIAVDEAREERGDVFQLTDNGIEHVDGPAPPDAPKAVLTRRGRDKIEALAAQAEEAVIQSSTQDEDPGPDDE
jgi:recombination protein RecT